MKVISVDVARATWLFPVAEINPKGLNLSEAFQGLTARYDFKRFPKHTGDVDAEAKGIVFNEGTFKNRDGIKILIKLTVFQDGLVVDCWSSTRDAEDFLKDAMEWLKTEHGLSIPPDRKVKTLYLSQLTVAPSGDWAGLNSKLQGLANKISSLTKDSGRDNAGFLVGGFSMWAKDWNMPGVPGAYRFEIKLGSAPGENRYFAAAALPTEAHIAILEEQERLLG
jgi:hypothetical protein